MHACTHANSQRLNVEGEVQVEGEAGGSGGGEVEGGAGEGGGGERGGGNLHSLGESFCNSKTPLSGRFSLLQHTATHCNTFRGSIVRSL